MRVGLFWALLALLLSPSAACSSSSTNPAASGGATGSGGTGGAAGGTGACNDNDGGLLLDDGGVEAGVGKWYGNNQLAISSIAACGAHSLQLSGPAPETATRHDFNPTSTGKYAFSFCARAVGGIADVYVHYKGPSTSDKEVQILGPVTVGTSAWTHLTTSPIDIATTGQHTIIVSISGSGATAEALFDCMSITSS